MRRGWLSSTSNSREKLTQALNDFHSQFIEIRRKLVDIINTTYIDGPTPYFDIYKSIEKLKTEVEDFLSENDLIEDAQKMSQQRLPSSQKVPDMIESVDTYISCIKKAEYKLKSQISSATKNFSEDNKGVPVLGNKVFIVHGHDEANLHKLRDLLKYRYKLDCIVMKWKAGQGRTLIEKFEQEAQDAGFAFILMTPDDLVKVEGKDEYAQARPNVIFELGWFYGKLKRDRVCILFKKGTKIHSDLDGISRIEFNESVEDKVLEIEKELKAAGLIEG